MVNDPFRSIRGRIIVTVTLLHAVLMGLVVADMMTRQQAFMQHQLAREGESLAQTLAVNAPGWLISNDVTGMGELVNSLRSSPNLKLALILDRYGKVRAATDPALFNLILNDVPSRQVIAAPGPRQLWHDGTVDSAAEIRSAGQTIGYARVVLEATAVQMELDAVLRKGIAYAVFAILSGGLVAWFTVRTVTERLARLSRAADRIAAGDLDLALAEDLGHDEVARLTRDFAQMAAALREDRHQRNAAEAQLFAEKERAQVTLASIGDGVITTDVSGRVTFLNPMAETLTGWFNAEALNLPLERVFRVIDEATRATAPSPLVIVLKGIAAGLVNHTLLLRRDGDELNIEHSEAPIRDRDGAIIGVVLVFRDVTQAHEMAKQMRWAATHDALTGLYNRSEFERRLQALIAAADSGGHHTLLYIDLDQFKVVNDTCGHAAGDQMLCQIAVLLRAGLGESDTLARLGGDEFGVLLENAPTEAGRKVAERLLEAIRNFRFVWDDKRFHVGASIGLVALSGEGLSPANLLAAADTACYTAKDEGRNRIQVFNASDSETLRRSGEMHYVARINRAFDDARFRLHWQAIEPLQPAPAGARDHGEILLRMIDDDGRLVPPAAFIPAAERYNLMPRIDHWVVQQALRWLVEQPRPERFASINLSGQSLSDERLLEFVLNELRHTGIDPTRVCFEITETAAIANLAKATRFIGALRGHGCRFSLDDFGSGLSSFGYLKNLPVDFLKIDGSFVRNITRNPIDQAMVAAINNIGHVMGLETIAEFVETEDARELLRSQGVDYGQGYGIARPVPLEDL